MSEASWTDPSVLTSAVIGGGIVFIAFRQWWTARSKLIFDLFEKRFAIYKATDHLLTTSLNEESISRERLAEFHYSTKEAYFLFDEETASYLEDTLLRKAHYFVSVNDSLGIMNANFDGRIPEHHSSQWNDLARERAQLQAWFAEAHNELPTRFAKYLRPGQPMIIPKDQTAD